MTGDESRERKTISRVDYITISRLCSVIPFLSSLTTELMVRKLQLSAEMQIPDVPAAWLHRVQSWALFRDTKLRRSMPVSRCWMRSWLSLPIPYGTEQSRMRLLVGRAMTFKMSVMTISKSRTPTANNQHTGSAGTMHHEVHLPIVMASRSKHTRGTIVKLD